jgi:hypothetical protein
MQMDVEHEYRARMNMFECLACPLESPAQLLACRFWLAGNVHGAAFRGVKSAQRKWLLRNQSCAVQIAIAGRGHRKYDPANRH